jgi:acyl dehydratase
MPPLLRVRAVNTATDSENRIHDDQIAAEYGFRGGLVPGVTIYGYMASAVIEHFGPEWLERGAMDVRFFQPFYEGEEVAVTISDAADRKIKVEAGTRATATAWLESSRSGPRPDHCDLATKQPATSETIRPGVTLGSIEKTLNLSEPGMSAPLDSHIGPDRLAHPAILLSLANEILISNYILGPWIHSSSEIRNANPARDGENLHVRGKIIDAYERKGHEFVVLDVAILSGDALITRFRHTAIWKLRK